MAVILFIARRGASRYCFYRAETLARHKGMRTAFGNGEKTRVSTACPSSLRVPAQITTLGGKPRRPDPLKIKELLAVDATLLATADRVSGAIARALAGEGEAEVVNMRERTGA